MAWSISFKFSFRISFKFNFRSVSMNHDELYYDHLWLQSCSSSLVSRTETHHDDQSKCHRMLYPLDEPSWSLARLSKMAHKLVFRRKRKKKRFARISEVCLSCLFGIIKSSSLRSWNWTIMDSADWMMFFVCQELEDIVKLLRNTDAWRNLVQVLLSTTSQLTVCHYNESRALICLVRRRFRTLGPAMPVTYRKSSSEEGHTHSSSLFRE